MQIIGMTVYAVHVNHRGNWVVVLLRTDGGRTGLGEASHGGLAGDDGMAALLLEHCFPVLRGQDPRQPLPVIAAMRQLVVDHATATAMSACEQALWDLAGKAAGTPAAYLLTAGLPGGGNLGAEPHALPLYANINRATVDRSPAGFVATARAAAADGFGAVKLAPFDGMAPGGEGQEVDQDLVERGLACVAAVRAAMPPAVEVLVDCHSHFDVATALRAAAHFRRLGVTWFEEPVPTPDLGALRHVRAGVPDLALIGGETLFGLEGFRPYLEGGLWDVAMPDVKHCGGLAAMLAIAGLAAERNVIVAPHNPSGPVATAASAQAHLLLPSAGRLEYAWGEVPWRASLVQPPERVADGRLHMSGSPGIGVELNPAVLRQHLSGSWSS